MTTIHTDMTARGRRIRSATWYEELGENGHIRAIHYSPEMRRMLGYEDERDFPDDLETLVDHIHPDDRRKMLDAAIAAGTGRADGYDVEYRIRMKSGEYLWVNATGKRLCAKDGTPRILHGSVIDISEIAENRRLHDEMNDYVAVIDGLSSEYIVVWMTHGPGHILKLIRGMRTKSYLQDVIRAAEGKPYEAIMPLYIDRVVIDEDKERFREMTSLETLRRSVPEKGIYACTFRRNEPGSAPLYRQICFSRIAGGRGERNYVIAFRDVDALMHEELEKQLKLERARDEADAANKAKSYFLFNMSHDIRTPMNAIIGFTDLALKKSTDEAKRLEYLRNIQMSGRHLLEILNGVLEMARIESDKIVIAEDPTDTQEFFSACIMVFSEEIRKKSLSCTAENRVTAPFLYMDKTHVEEIVINIISNAIKYTPKGGALNITATQLPGADEDSCIVEFVTEDSGIGMSEEFQSHVFESFSRERNTTMSGIKGTGLGLAIVKRLVELMGGTIRIESRLAKGTRVVIRMPHRIVRDPAGKRKSADHPPEANFSGRRILLAEDVDLNAEIAVEILTEAGFTVDRAEDGVVCLDMLAGAPAGTYDLILMDVQMPNMDGYRATEEIRRLSDKRKAGIPIIAMTANAFREDAEKAVNAGMDAHIAKPVNARLLLKTLAGMLH